MANSLSRDGRLKNGQQAVYDLPAGTHRLQVKLDWNTSTEVAVTLAPGERAVFACGPGPGGSGKQMLRAMSNPGEYFKLVREQ